jgi:hypothetical protein
MQPMQAAQIDPLKRTAVEKNSPAANATVASTKAATVASPKGPSVASPKNTTVTSPPKNTQAKLIRQPKP